MTEYRKTLIVGGPWHGKRVASYMAPKHGAIFHLPAPEEWPTMADDVFNVEPTGERKTLELRFHQFNFDDVEDPVFLAAPVDMETSDVFFTLLEGVTDQTVPEPSTPHKDKSRR